MSTTTTTTATTTTRDRGDRYDPIEWAQKLLELSAPNLVHNYNIVAGPRHAVILGFNGQGTRQQGYMKYTTGVGDACHYDCLDL